jgi:hypothetical protein
MRLDEESAGRSARRRKGARMRQAGEPRRAGIEEPDLTERELATLEGVSVRTVQHWRQRGEGPKYRKLGAAKRALVRYPVAWYREWRERGATNGTAQGYRGSDF